MTWAKPDLPLVLGTLLPKQSWNSVDEKERKLKYWTESGASAVSENISVLEREALYQNEKESISPLTMNLEIPA